MTMLPSDPIPLRVSFAELEINAYEERLLAQLERERMVVDLDVIARTKTEREQRQDQLRRERRARRR
jgi:hypothetical protein